MVSQVFYRKWRPQTLADIVGQEHVTRTLRNAVVQGKVSHAYLFCGPRGTGKTSTGRVLAKAVNCISSKDGEPCNSCEVCLSITQGRALDVVEIDAASNRSIDDIRELRERVAYAPGTARKKVYIIDEVHMLTEPAANALLKTLEEPPPHAIFILATTEPHKILPTILSRCQRFEFRRLSQAVVAAKLSRICVEEGIVAEPAALNLIARSVSGSLRDAENVLEQLVAYYGQSIDVHQVEESLGITTDWRVRELAKQLVARDLRAGMETINSVAREGVELKQFGRALVEYLRWLMVVKSGVPEVLDLSPEDLAEVKGLADGATLVDIMRALKLFGQIDFQRNEHSPLPLELAFVECTLPTERKEEQRVSSMAPAERPPAAAPQVARRPAPRAAVAMERPVAPAPRSPAEPPEVDPAGQATPPAPAAAVADGVQVDPVFADVRDRWDDFVDSLRGVGSSGNLDAYLRSACEPVAVEGDTVVLRFYHEFHMKTLENQKYRHLVEDRLKLQFAGLSKVRCILMPKAGQKSADGPLVRAALKMGARIKNVTESPESTRGE